MHKQINILRCERGRAKLGNMSKTTWYGQIDSGLITTGAADALLTFDPVFTLLTAVHFTEGEYVKAGDKLFTIDPRPYQTAFNQAQANLDYRLTKDDQKVQ